jgi:hypothetical protein
MITRFTRPGATATPLASAQWRRHNRVVANGAPAHEAEQIKGQILVVLDVLAI